MNWIQVRDVHAKHARRAAAGVPVARDPLAEPWDLIEMQVEDPDGIRIALADVPAGHPFPPLPATGVTAGTTNRMPYNSAFHGNAAA